MKIKHIYILGISSMLWLLPLTAWSQTEDTPDTTEVDTQAVKDSIRITNRYGLRIGAMHRGVPSHLPYWTTRLLRHLEPQGRYDAASGS